MSKPSKEMESILQAYGNKCLANAITVSAHMQNDPEMLKACVEEIAKDIVRHATHMGHEPVFNSCKVFVKHAWMTDATEVAAKIYTEMTATPTQFMAFMGFRMEEMRQETESAKHDAKSEHDRFFKLARAAYGGMTTEDLAEMAKEMLGYNETGDLEDLEDDE